MAPARHGLDTWLRELGLSQQQRFDILLSIGEAVSNAIQHGSGLDPERTVGIEVFALADEITATVSDSGRWTADSAASRRETRGGRGLTLMHGLATRVTTVRQAHGTQITLRYRRNVGRGSRR